MKKMLISVVTLFISQTQASMITPLVSAGFETGGDKLAEISYSDGSRSKMTAGQGFHIDAGLLTTFGMTESTFASLQTTLGYKSDSTKQASNANLTWSHVVFEALGFYNMMDPQSKYGYRLGGGLTANFGNKLKGDGIADFVDFSAKTALGVVLHGDFAFGSAKQFMIGARYTFIKYDIENVQKVSGNSFGLTFTYLFKTIPLFSAPGAQPDETPTPGL